jgi:two-component system OmpR family sensor kinase
MSSREVSLVDLVVHELRTPLTVAIGSLRQLAGLADPVQQAAVARALRSCERLEHLSGQMRDWTRLEDSPSLPGAVALSPALAEAVRTASDARAAAVDFVVSGLPDVRVRALPDLLSGALASLLAAVARAAEAGETVAVEVTLTGDAATVVARRNGAPAADDDGTFAAEWLGGLGFSLPLARAVIAAGGGGLTSTHAADGRLQAITARLAVARPEPSR